MSHGGTDAYRHLPAGVVVPPLVSRAVDIAAALDFPHSVRPEIGRLLAVLAGGVPAGGLVGETGTGTGVGLAWMATSAPRSVRFVSYEQDRRRAERARILFAVHENVEVVHGDGAELLDRGPFDLLVHDGGPGSGKQPGDAAVDPGRVLTAGGTMTIDDYTPTATWPPLHDGALDLGRIRWLEHPDLHTTEVRVAHDLAVLVARRLPRGA